MTMNRRQRIWRTLKTSLTVTQVSGLPYSYDHKYYFSRRPSRRTIRIGEHGPVATDAHRPITLNTNKPFVYRLRQLSRSHPTLNNSGRNAMSHTSHQSSPLRARSKTKLYVVNTFRNVSQHIQMIIFIR